MDTQQPVIMMPPILDINVRLKRFSVMSHCTELRRSCRGAPAIAGYLLKVVSGRSLYIVVGSAPPSVVTGQWNGSVF